MRINIGELLWQYLVCLILKFYQAGVCQMVATVVLSLHENDHHLRCLWALLWVELCLPKRYDEVLIPDTYKYDI